MFGSFVARPWRVTRLLTLLTVIVVVACGAAPYKLAASGPIGYSADVDPSVTRVAVVVTITNVSGDDLAVDPTDFLVRDAAHHVYPANPTAAVADARAVRLAVASVGASQSTAPLPTITLRGNDILSGFLVIDVPVGVQPVELGMRQARYFGRTKTHFQLLLAATVANLTLIATRVVLMGDRSPRDDPSVTAVFVVLAVLVTSLIPFAPRAALFPSSTPDRRTGFRPRF